MLDDLGKKRPSKNRKIKHEIIEVPIEPHSPFQPTRRKKEEGKGGGCSLARIRVVCALENYHVVAIGAKKNGDMVLACKYSVQGK